MLVQTPSKIFKADFRIWNEGDKNAVAEILKNEEKGNALISIQEVLLDVDGELRLSFDGVRTILLMPLYGEIITNNFTETISAGESLVFNVEKDAVVAFKNHVYHDKADFLIFEFEKQENIQQYSKNEVDFSLKNNQLKISEQLKIPNFIGLYDGRAEGFYTLKNPEKSIFGMVINGAFEFQNRLMETRDAILLWEINELEFEALSEDALILFMEI